MTEQFTHDIIQSIIAHVCSQNQFQTISQSAMETLIGAVIRFIEKISITASKITLNCGRTESNIYDVLYSMMENGINNPVQAIVQFMMFNENAFPKYDYCICKYPLDVSIQFYSYQKEAMMANYSRTQKPNEIFVPFRANTTIKYNSEQKTTNPNNNINKNDTDDNKEKKEPDHIPSFFPKFPDFFTYDSIESETQTSNIDNDLQEELSKRREDDQQNIKKELSKLSNIQMIKSANLKCELTGGLDDSHFISIPNPEISSKEIKYGSRSQINPEFLPGEKISEENCKMSSITPKEIKNYVKILNSKHNSNENQKDK